jgi:phosphoserine phosphatase
MKYKKVIFDLDDTLVSEIDFLKSAYYYIAAQLGKDNLYEQMLEKYFVLTRKIFAFPSLQHRSAFGKSFPQSAGIIK